MDSPQTPLSLLTIALLSLIPLFIFFFFNRSKGKQPKEPPTIPGAWPILGHLPLLARSPTTHHLLGAIADDHGPLFTIKLGTVKALVVSNWETAKECFTTNDVAVSYRPYVVATEHMTYNVAMLGLHENNVVVLYVPLLSLSTFFLSFLSLLFPPQNGVYDYHISLYLSSNKCFLY